MSEGEIDGSDRESQTEKERKGEAQRGTDREIKAGR